MAFVYGAQQTDDRLYTRGWTPGERFRASEAITIKDFHSVNPITLEEVLGVDRSLTITQPTEANEAGEAYLSVSPMILPSGPHRNCAAPPLNGAEIIRW